ncbi:MAG: hypothetical protein CFH22_01462 [Alphaproteobacteria bacterium MarineAlpha5_Bin12]|nr:hypothetical protein [Pelagibacteraceae bacterium]PPR40559.1 MAG: hypothetical protein CFH22_01462 [Alphaproteobacteria bacterium MarineAlpha5_Bin12]|tara:strand:- start:1149 stop:2120 length:972 start_codon:yes stop_codon:yes gene_type:complete
MHKYFLIPVIIFFIIICLLVIYSQYFYVDWKYDFIPESFDPKTERYKEKILPEICDDDAEIKIIKQTNDFIEKRVWKDQAEITNVPSIHAIYFLPCDGEDREFDVNGSINSSIKSINVWFLNKTKNQIINFDKSVDDTTDVTFIRVNKTLKWFIKFNTNENSNKDTGSKIEKIILSNQNLFNNFENKKFIIFFEGREKRISLLNKACGRSRHNGKIAIFYTNGINKKIKSCTKDNLNNSITRTFGESEQTILHEILHTLGVPFECGKNTNFEKTMHVLDNKDDIMNNVSGSLYLDYNNDDYYKHNITNCPDLFNSKFLETIKK